MDAGGKIYQARINPKKYKRLTKKQLQTLGPHRVLPGRLSVSRTFGDIQAKLKKHGGNPKVLIAKPDIKILQL